MALARFLTAVLFLSTGCTPGGSTPGPGSTQPVAHVQMAVEWLHGQVGSSCDLAGGSAYTDQFLSAQVTVANESGTIVGVGTLPTQGKVEQGPKSGDLQFQYCVLTVDVTVQEAQFYSFSVAHLGPLTLSRDELSAAAWTIRITG